MDSIPQPYANMCHIQFVQFDIVSPFSFSGLTIHLLEITITEHVRLLGYSNMSLLRTSSINVDDVDEKEEEEVDRGTPSDNGVDNKVASIALAFPSTDEIKASPNSTSPLTVKCDRVM
jgi:hypothetical protein